MDSQVNLARLGVIMAGRWGLMTVAGTGRVVLGVITGTAMGIDTATLIGCDRR